MTREDEMREIDEAIYAGRNALNAIGEAENHLGSARGFGVWDMLGGGLISGLLKHSEMDSAGRYVDEARNALERFQRELRDVNVNFNYGVQFDGVTKMFDLLFDNILVDALVQSRIKETQENLRQTKMQVQQTLNQLESMRRNL